MATIRFYGEFKDEIGDAWRINIHDVDYNGTAYEIKLGAANSTCTVHAPACAKLGDPSVRRMCDNARPCFLQARTKSGLRTWGYGRGSGWHKSQKC